MGVAAPAGQGDDIGDRGKVVGLERGLALLEHDGQAVDPRGSRLDQDPGARALGVRERRHHA